MKQDYDALVALMLDENTNTSTTPKIVYGPMNEVYLGGNAVAGIQSVMDQIVKVLTDDPSTIIVRHPLTRKLENEVQKAFGFKYVRIEWHAGMGTSSAPINAEKFKHRNNSAFVQGTHSKGFYDTDHVMSVYIVMDSTLITDAGCTSREMTAVLLHEIGHNFDFTPMTLYAKMSTVLTMVVELLSSYSLAVSDKTGIGKRMFAADARTTISNLALLPIMSLPFTKEVMLRLIAIRDYILDSLPPVQKFAHAVKVTRNTVIKFIASMTSPWSAITSIIGRINKIGQMFTSPVMIFTIPLRQLLSIMYKQGEIYADSFASTYGYGEDFATFMIKVDRFTTIPNEKKSTQVFAVMYDFAYCYTQISDMVSSGSKHPNTTKRIRRTIDKLERDLNAGNVDPNLKKELELQLKSVKDQYDRLINMNETEYTFVSRLYTKFIESYYNSSLGSMFDYDDSFAE